MNISAERLGRIQKKMREKGLDALFCRLSEHVLYFTGYWPHNHGGAALVPVEGKPLLLLSEMEARLELGSFKPAEGVSVLTFPFESAEVLRSLNEGLAVVLPGAFERLGLLDKVVGVELGFEGCNTGIFQGEVKYPAGPTWRMLERLFPKVRFVDGSQAILDLRMVKSEEEIDAIRRTVELAGLGMAAAQSVIAAGRKETEVASLVESLMHSMGTGSGGICQVRGYACVYSGERGADGWSHYAYSSSRMINSGDVVLVELGAFADGYWADLTRNFCAGQVSERAREILKIVRDAQQLAIEAARPGAAIRDVDRAARDHIEKHGYGKQFPHGLGHGVGTAYHEGPALHKANPGVLEENMVLTIEPGIYIPGFGGIRAEDMIVVRRGGAEVLSKVVPYAFE